MTGLNCGNDDFMKTAYFSISQRSPLEAIKDFRNPITIKSKFPQDFFPQLKNSKIPRKFSKLPSEDIYFSGNRRIPKPRKQRRLRPISELPPLPLLEFFKEDFNQALNQEINPTLNFIEKTFVRLNSVTPKSVLARDTILQHNFVSLPKPRPSMVPFHKRLHSREINWNICLEQNLYPK